MWEYDAKWYAQRYSGIVLCGLISQLYFENVGKFLSYFELVSKFDVLSFQEYVSKGIIISFVVI